MKASVKHFTLGFVQVPKLNGKAVLCESDYGAPK